MDFEDGTRVFLTTPGRGDLPVLNPGGNWGYPRGCAHENPREERLTGTQGGVADFGYMLPAVEDYERVIANVAEFGGKLMVRCDHGGSLTHTYLADPDGYVVDHIQRMKVERRLLSRKRDLPGHSAGA
ncbi:MAG TPA: hypothetical protein VJ728_12335 [Candidatus Binataceae bacterium]|nr:hypothetical protein [Candidatus Binataceae bacterium]